MRLRRWTADKAHAATGSSGGAKPSATAGNATRLLTGNATRVPAGDRRWRVFAHFAGGRPRCLRQVESMAMVRRLITKRIHTVSRNSPRLVAINRARQLS